MKIVSVNRAKEISDNKDNSYSIAILPDSSITRDSDLFYNPFPNFKVRFSAGICLKISKIGKCISEKFASKYYENIGLALHFFSDEYKRYCIAKELDYVLSYAFDKSFLVLDFTVLDLQTAQFGVKVNDSVFLAEPISLDILNNAITQASEYITLKVGDIVYVPFFVSESELKENDTLSLLSDVEKICSIKIL